jgi:putative SOS response-associated peptidase YedK
VPASFFYEFTGRKSPKTKWKFSKVAEQWFCFAGLWRPMSTGGEAYTLLTTDPSADAGYGGRLLRAVRIPDARETEVLRILAGLGPGVGKTTVLTARIARIRQMVILEQSDWSAWLEQTGSEADLLRALPPGSLNVEQVR